MNKNKVTEEITLHEILGEFLDSYADGHFRTGCKNPDR